MSIAPGIPLKRSETENNNNSTGNHTPLVHNYTASDRASASASASTCIPLACDCSSAAASIDIEELFSASVRRPLSLPPIVPALCPYRVQLRAGRKYRYCKCGRSAKQPWCDDSHLPTDPQPIEFVVSADSMTSVSWLCGCKYSASQPYCDGSHIHVHKGTEEE